MWKTDLKSVNEKAADALADPEKYPNLFPDLDWAVKVEEIYKSARFNHVAAASYPTAKNDLELDLIEMVKSQATTTSSAPVAAPKEPSKDEEDEEVAKDDELVAEIRSVSIAPPASEPVVSPALSPKKVASPLPSPKKEVSPLPSPEKDSVSKTTAVTESKADVENDDDEDFDALLAEETEALKKSTPVPSQPVAAPAEDDDDDDVDLDEDEGNAEDNAADDTADLLDEDEEDW